MVGGHVFDFAPEGRSLTVKHPKAKVTKTGRTWVSLQFLCNASWILEPTQPEKVGRFSESDPEDVVSTGFLGIFGPENRGGSTRRATWPVAKLQTIWDYIVYSGRSR